MTTDSGKGREAEEKVFNSTKTLELLDGDCSLAMELIAIYQEQTPKLLLQLGEAIRNQDLQLVSRLSHKLKGSFRNFYAYPSIKIAQELEDECKGSCRNHIITPLRDALLNEVRNLSQALESWKQELRREKT